MKKATMFILAFAVLLLSACGKTEPVGPASEVSSAPATSVPSTGVPSVGVSSGASSANASSFADPVVPVDGTPEPAQSAESSPDAAENGTELAKWYLLLVNDDHTMPEGYVPKTSEIKSRFVMQESGRYFDKRAVDDLNKMFEAARVDGISIKSLSSYRSISHQSRLYENKVKHYLDRDYTPANARVEAAKTVAVPGTSEHSLGLAVDINSLEQSFEKTAEYRWLSRNAAEYGFVERYPKDKQDITKKIYEPWHYRYVSPAHAKKMKELSMCLEEYVEWLKTG